ncbi:hypothetical protein [Methylocystis parvus]|uniref:hypothetical protein n=1 Tax=Methylocystis parvus TaxID=134 RepID=UPI0002DFD6A4|nr:hypothetical protein [Methylocystis parvus]WBJ99715.1 hypothetical protein MMG94_17275 [Methylocystis parvus OBBP]
MDKVNALIDWLKPRLSRAFWFTLALIFLIESWLWDNVKEWLRRLERALGLEKFEPWLESVVARLSPQMTLALFAAPMIGVLPFKIAALALLAHGQLLLGIVFIFGAKALTLGVEAFLFDICRDKLLQMQWFGRVYSIVLDIRAWASMLVRPYKTRLAEIGRDIRIYAEQFIGKEGGAFSRRIARLRELARPNRSR